MPTASPSTATAVLEGGDGGLGLRFAGGPRVTARTDLLRAPRRGGGDALYRAVLAGTQRVIDATAGLGGDAFHLASRGVEVTMIERQPLVAALLADALARAAAGDLGPAAVAAARRLRLAPGDAVELLEAMTAGVVLLDPMFPATGSSAATAKGMDLLRRLTTPSQDAPVDARERRSEELALLGAARRAATRRVVVKRAVRAAPLAGVTPSGSLGGRSVRFDLYAPEMSSREEAST